MENIAFGDPDYDNDEQKKNNNNKNQPIKIVNA
jgi:hypothetical protein